MGSNHSNNPTTASESNNPSKPKTWNVYLTSWFRL
jgi:hypothetical protein